MMKGGTRGDEGDACRLAGSIGDARAIEAEGEGKERIMVAGERRVMGRKPVLAFTTLFIAMGLVAGLMPLAAQEAPPPIAPEVLTPRSIFTDDVDLKIKIKQERGRTVVVNTKEPSRTVVVRYTVQPRAQFPWHSHAGPVVVNVVQGSLVYVPAEDCSQREYRAGTAFVDPGHGHVHSAFNPQTEGETVFVATFFGAPAEGPLLIPAQAPQGCLVG